MTKTVKDMLGRVIQLNYPPQRIISLVPSQTELLHVLGLGEQVVGITQFCVHPGDWRKQKTIIGGTKKLQLEKIRHLKPDLIIANKEENNKEDIAVLEKEFPVWVSDVSTVADGLSMIELVGYLLGKESNASALINSIKTAYNNCSLANKERVAYLIWKNPLMTVGDDTFIADQLRRSGLKNVFAQKKRYPSITEDELRDAALDLLFLSSEPFPFKEKHIDRFSKMLPNTRILLVDGELFSWYGSRMQYAPAYFAKLIEQIRH